MGYRNVIQNFLKNTTEIFDGVEFEYRSVISIVYVVLFYHFY